MFNWWMVGHSLGSGFCRITVERRQLQKLINLTITNLQLEQKHTENIIQNANNKSVSQIEWITQRNV